MATNNNTNILNNTLKLFQATRIKAGEMMTDMVGLLGKYYGQSRDAFSYSSSWGQIILVMNNHFQLVMHYFQDAITEANPMQAKRNNSIYGNAALIGHDPTRNRTAIGEISLRYKGDPKRVKGDKIFIPNLSKVLCLDNQLTYSVDLADDDIIISLNSASNYNLRIKEGIWDLQTFTGTGEDLQSFEVNTAAGQQIDAANYIVTVNDVEAKRYDSLEDIPFGVLGYVGRTGVYSGIDILFGNQMVHRVPQIGELIRVDYLVTNGLAGNILGKSATFQFTDTAFDGTGASVDINELFDVKVTILPQLGANAEPPELTRRIMSMKSQYTVLHDKNSIAYYFERLNIFNIVKVYRDDELTGNDAQVNQFTAFLVPNIKDRISGNENYFSTDLNNFMLSQSEKTRLYNSIQESGRMSTSFNIQIVDPVIRRFTLNLFVEAFELFEGQQTDKFQLKQDIQNTINQYLLGNTRLNKIPNSDIVRLIDQLPAVDTLKAVFVSENGAANEYGIDNLGNILVAPNELAVIRGGWTSQTGVVYEDSVNVENEKPCSINIYITLI